PHRDEPEGDAPAIRARRPRRRSEDVDPGAGIAHAAPRGTRGMAQPARSGRSATHVRAHRDRHALHHAAHPAAQASALGRPAWTLPDWARWSFTCRFRRARAAPAAGPTGPRG